MPDMKKATTPGCMTVLLLVICQTSPKARMTTVTRMDITTDMKMATKADTKTVSRNKKNDRPGVTSTEAVSEIPQYIRTHHMTEYEGVSLPLL